MRISSEQLADHLRKSMASLYVLFGDEILLMVEAMDLILFHAQQLGYTEREIYTVEQHFNWLSLRNASNSLSLFGSRKIIDIRIPSGKPGKEGGGMIEAYCASIPPDTLTLVTLPKIDKATQNAAWFKALENRGVVIPFNAIEREQLPDWIAKRLEKQQQKTDTATLRFMVDQVEGNLLAAHQEIQKLALVYPAGHLSLDEVRAVIFNMARYDVYQLADALIALDQERFARILSALKNEGMAPLLILTVLTEQIRQLINLRKGINSGRPIASLLQTERIWKNRQKTVMNAVKQLKFESLRQAILHAARMDRMMKGIVDGDIWNELQQFVTILAVNADAPMLLEH
ncbi:DNA polymerase III subunit delta [Nitrosomonas sp. PY1]|uniref:DNA polymerase III subunit delta n=1 Tax=Nitrosomonas sp. PY1 TaxID=1803906 RepID=UPI001FC7CFDD|nr:DNA polymerase III subunit delta [Nitrosomonas sp. PY1]